MPGGWGFTGLCGTADREIGWGYAKQVEVARDDRSLVGSRLGISERAAVDEGRR
jgi:hypothetical protein